MTIRRRFAMTKTTARLTWVRRAREDLRDLDAALADDDLDAVEEACNDALGALTMILDEYVDRRRHPEEE